MSSLVAVDHYENFPVASLLLPPRFRRPVALIYRFAREADDFADEGNLPPDTRLARLDAFRREIGRIETGKSPTIPWFAALADVIHEYRLPLDLFRDLLSAFSQDVTKTRYANFGEVLDYCRRSANPVGRLLLCLYGSWSTQNIVYSDAICSSLQLINFIQDVALDYQRGRIYLPQDELARFDVAEQQIAAGDSGRNWQRFIAFQIERTRELLYSGAPLGRVLKGRIGMEMRMIMAGGDRVLTKIARVGGDVFKRRPTLQPLDWPLMFLHAVR
ncbi:MAG TPA: squalene synthase HpnC [Burkholderiales bacterium]|nr:squalene synthase HpnC [Burkholderiales bacterium]